MKRVLVVVDYQNDFVDGALGFKAAEALDTKIRDKILEFHASGDAIILTMDTHKADYMDTEEGKNLPIPHCIEGSRTWELYGEVGELANKLGLTCVTKPTFPSKELADRLIQLNASSNGQIKEVEICGIVTNMCVISNAVIAKMALPNAHIKILSDLCSSFDMDMHKKALEVMASMQMEVV